MHRWSRCTGAQVHRCTGAQVHRCTGAQVHRCTGAQVHRCTGAQVHRCMSIGAGAQVHMHLRDCVCRQACWQSTEHDGGAHPCLRWLCLRSSSTAAAMGAVVRHRMHTCVRACDHPFDRQPPHSQEGSPWSAFSGSLPASAAVTATASPSHATTYSCKVSAPAACCGASSAVVRRKRPSR